MIEEECCIWRQALKDQSLLGLCPNFTRETELSWLVLLLLLGTLVMVVVPCTYLVLRREYRRAKAAKQKKKTSAIIAAHEAAKKEISKPEEPVKMAMVAPTVHRCEDGCNGARHRGNGTITPGLTILQMPVPMQQPLYERWGSAGGYELADFSPKKSFKRSSRISSYDDLSQETGTLNRNARVRRLEPLPLPSIMDQAAALSTPPPMELTSDEEE